MEKDAIISPTGLYRYALRRKWNDLPQLGWLMLNPSTADHLQDDPTIRRCIGFAKANGFGGIVVCNLFAWRATDPATLWALPYTKAVGQHNDRHILQNLRDCSQVVAAWGAFRHAWLDQRVPEVWKLWPQFYCLGLTSMGAPRHPLFVPKIQPIVPCRLVAGLHGGRVKLESA